MKVLRFHKAYCNVSLQHFLQDTVLLLGIIRKTGAYNSYVIKSTGSSSCSLPLSVLRAAMSISLYVIRNKNDARVENIYNDPLSNFALFPSELSWLPPNSCSSPFSLSLSPHSPQAPSQRRILITPEHRIFHCSGDQYLHIAECNVLEVLSSPLVLAKYTNPTHHPSIYLQIPITCSPGPEAAP